MNTNTCTTIRDFYSLEIPNTNDTFVKIRSFTFGRDLRISRIGGNVSLKLSLERCVFEINFRPLSRIDLDERCWNNVI